MGYAKLLGIGVLLMLVPLAYAFTAQEIQDSVILSMTFDEGIGKDSSTEGRTCTVNGGVNVSDTVFAVGNASVFHLDTVNNPIVCSNDANMNSLGNISYLVWLNITDKNDIMIVFGREGVDVLDGGMLDIRTDGSLERISCNWQNDAGADALARADGLTAFFSTTGFELIGCHLNKSGGGVTAYLTLNTTVIAQSSFLSGDYGSPTQNLHIGDAQTVNNGERYKDGMDEFCLFNMTLSTDDIEIIWNNGVGKACHNLVAADSCTPPASGDWDITCSDFCIFTDNQDVPGNITMTGAGEIKQQSSFTFTGDNQYINIGAACTYALDSGAQYLEG